MARDPKPYDGESTPEELMDIHKGVDQDTPPTETEEAEDITKEFGDDEESAA